MRLLKKLLLSFALVFGYPKLSNSWWISPRQVVRPSIDNVSAVNEWALLVRRPVQGGWGDTSIAPIDPYPSPVGLWGSDYKNFSPWLKLSDTLYAIIEKNVNGKIYRAKSKWCPNVFNGEEEFWAVYLDNPEKEVKAHGINIEGIFSFPPQHKYCYLKKNPEQKIPADSNIYPWPPNVVELSFNLEKQDSLWNHGDSARIDLEKIITHYTPDGYPLYNKKYFTTLNFSIDTTWGMIQGFWNVNFPQDSNIQDPYSPIIDSISHNLIDGDAILKARIRDYSNVYDTLFYEIRWQDSSLNGLATPDSIINNYHYYKISGIPPNAQCTVKCDIKAKDVYGNSSNAYYEFYAYWTKAKEKTYVIDEKNSKKFKVLYLGNKDYKRLKKMMEKGFDVYDVSGRRIKKQKFYKGIYIIKLF